MIKIKVDVQLSQAHAKQQPYAAVSQPEFRIQGSLWFLILLSDFD